MSDVQLLLQPGHPAAEIIQSHSLQSCHSLLFVVSINITTTTEFYSYFQVAGEKRYLKKPAGVPIEMTLF